MGRHAICRVDLMDLRPRRLADSVLEGFLRQRFTSFRGNKAGIAREDQIPDHYVITQASGAERHND